MKTVVEFEPLNIAGITANQLAAMELTLKKEAKTVVEIAKSNIQSSKSVRTGSLLKAVTSKVKQPKNKDCVYAIIGIDNKYASYDDAGNKIKPAKYAHLVEFGTKNKMGTFFLTQAANARKQAIMNALTKAAEDGAKF